MGTGVQALLNFVLDRSGKSSENSRIQIIFI